MRLVDSFNDWFDRELELWIRLGGGMRPPIVERRGCRFALTLEFMLDYETRTYTAQAQLVGVQYAQQTVGCELDAPRDLVVKKMREAATDAIAILVGQYPELADDMILGETEGFIAKACGSIVVCDRSTWSVKFDDRSTPRRLTLP